MYSLRVEAIYENISWRTGLSYVWVAMAFLIVVVSHIIGQIGWYKCKKPVYERRRREEVIEGLVLMGGTAKETYGIGVSRL